MSDRVEERRQTEVHDQNRLKQEKTTKEKEASAAKFKQAFSQRSTGEQKTDTQKKNEQGQKQFNQNLLMSRNGIANRSVAERLVKNKDDDSKNDKELVGSREKDLKTDNEKGDLDRVEAREDAAQQAQQEQKFDAPIKNDEQNRGDQQGQGNPQGQGQPGQQQPGQQQQKDKDKEDKGIGGIGASQKAGKPDDAKETSGTQNAGKVAIGKTMRAAASERIPQPVMQGMVDKVSTMVGQGMQEFQIQLKDDALGGGSLRVTIGKDKKLTVAFTLKDQNAKNLIESSKGVLMRMFERKGMALQSLTVKLRGEA